MNSADIKSKIDSALFTTVKRMCKSEIFNIFYDIKDSNDEIIKDYVLCIRCNNVYKFNENSKSNLLRHNCYKKYKSSKEVTPAKIQPTKELKKYCTELCVQWIVGDCRPFNAVNDEGIDKLAQFFIKCGHEFGNNLDTKSLIPHSTTVSRNVENLYDEQHSSLKQELCSIKEVGFSITCDLWTDNFVHETYIGITAHYIKNGSLIHKTIGMRGMGEDRSTGKI